MKTITLSNIIKVCMIIIGFSSCQSDIQDLTDTNNLNLDKISAIRKLNTNILDLSASDAIIVANIHSTETSKTRTISPLSIKNVVPIRNSQGSVSIYAVNYDDGYILVSASKKYYPILAVVEHGNYPDFNINTGQALIINDLINNIEIAKREDTDLSVNYLWNKYIADDTPAPNQNTTRSKSDEYWQAYDNWYANIPNSGNVSIRLLKNGGEYLPDDVYQEFRTVASSEDLWEGTEYSWENTAYLVETTIYETNNTGPLLSTKWGQSSPFNTTQYQYLGCVTVATGQLMKFYKKPSNIDWNAMPNDYSSETLCNFLANLRDELKVNENGGTAITNAENVFKNYGYSIEKIKHNSNRIYSSIRAGKPVFAKGMDELSDSGHAWVIDGVNQSLTKVRYQLYILSDAYYPNFKYVTADGCYYEYCDELITYHMNWGWDGNHNGYYIDQRPWVVENGQYKFKFSNNREEIIFK